MVLNINAFLSIKEQEHIKDERRNDTSLCLFDPHYYQCVFPEKIHTHVMEVHWKFQGELGGGILKAKFL